jgi:hypothetical protein
LKGFNLLEVASVGHHGGELFEGIELVHADIIQPCPRNEVRHGNDTSERDKDPLGNAPNRLS